MQLLLDAVGIEHALKTIAAAILGDAPADAGLAVIGIRSRGDVLAERLLPLLRVSGDADIEHGALDITLYRDDLAEIGPDAVVRKTEIPFDIDDRYIILVDDVLWTGRTIRAALDALMDLGRPRAIRLAVLADRPGRELPIQADYIGIRTASEDGHVRVMLADTDDEETVQIQ
jgi:pyrimidine operon attenuation protein/uracil phosphoribosyltransferase